MQQAAELLGSCAPAKPQPSAGEEQKAALQAKKAADKEVARLQGAIAYNKERVAALEEKLEKERMHRISHAFMDFQKAQAKLFIRQRFNTPILCYYSSDETPMATAKRWTFGFEDWKITRHTKASTAWLIKRGFVVDVHGAMRSKLGRPLQCPDKTCPTFFSASRK